MERDAFAPRFLVHRYHGYLYTAVVCCSPSSAFGREYEFQILSVKCHEYNL